jgi:splicing factor 3B subunit 2
MNSVVSTVAGGLETPDFLELRKHSGRAASEAIESGPRSLYQVVPEKQTSVRGLMGSERGYDVSAVAGAPIPILGDERGMKVLLLLVNDEHKLIFFVLTAQSQRCRCLY